MYEADEELPAFEVDMLLRHLLRVHSDEEGSADETADPFAAPIPDELKGLPLDDD